MTNTIKGNIDQIAYDGSEVVKKGTSFRNCPHATPVEKEEGQIPEYIIPWAIKIYTEGGYVADMECLECAIEVAREMGMKIKRKKR